MKIKKLNLDNNTLSDDPEGCLCFYEDACLAIKEAIEKIKNKITFGQILYKAEMVVRAEDVLSILEDI